MEWLYHSPWLEGHGVPPILRMKKLQVRLVNNLVFYLLKASCCRRGGPQTSKTDIGRRGKPLCYQVLPAPTLLSAGGGKR